jgi:stearoyl-CoA desaturase (delta-9 desaturase)
MRSKSRINWTNSLFLILVPCFAIIGTTILMVSEQLRGVTLLFALLFGVLNGISITAGYHRLFAHRSYRTAWPVRLFFLLLGAATFEGSALEWCTDHRNHHRYTDTDQDPYNIKRGFWYAHIGWLMVLDPSKRDFSNVADLTTDRLVKLQHRFYIPLAIITGFILPVVIASLWGDPWGGLIIAGALRITIILNMTFCINSFCHVFGKKNYQQQSACDSWITALFTFGEGFHNFHHQFAMDYRNGIRAYDYDPGKWLIRSLAYMGLAKDLKRATTEQIIRYKIHADESHLLKHVNKHVESSTYLTDLLKPLRDRILQTAAQLHQLEKDYLVLKTKKIEFLKGKMRDYRFSLNEQRKRLKKERIELKKGLVLWSALIRGFSAGSIPTRV